ncbi:MAG: microcin ABC transporter permease, partial [Rhodobacterales bacterium]
MGAYILRRLFLIIPTLIGIMLINFALIQFVPGGPIEQIIAQMEDGSAGATDRFTGGSGDDSVGQSESSEYKGARGLPPE